MHGVGDDVVTACFCRVVGVLVVDTLATAAFTGVLIGEAAWSSENCAGTTGGRGASCSSVSLSVVCVDVEDPATAFLIASSSARIN